MSRKPKAHRERAKTVAEHLGMIAADGITPSEEFIEEEVYDLTFPVELLKAAQRSLRCLEVIPAGSVGDLDAADAGDCVIAIREALALYEDKS